MTKSKKKPVKKTREKVKEEAPPLTWAQRQEQKAEDYRNGKVLFDLVLEKIKEIRNKDQNDISFRKAEETRA